MSDPALDSLRSTAPEAYFVLDDDDRIVHVSREFHDTRGSGVGHLFWEHLPRAQEIYGPVFEEARASGRPVETRKTSRPSFHWLTTPRRRRLCAPWSRSFWVPIVAGCETPTSRAWRLSL